MTIDTSEPRIARPSLPPGIDEAALARTRVEASFRIQPVGHIVGDVAGLLGEHLLSLMGMFYPRTLCRKANVVITELVTNVVENVYDPGSSVKLDLLVDAESLTIRVTNHVSDEQRAKVEARIHEINSTPDLRALLTKTLRERRAQKLKGGLGLMRLAQENKFKLSSSFDGGFLTVEAIYRVRDGE